MKIVLILLLDRERQISIRICSRVFSCMLRLKKGACSKDTPYDKVGSKKKSHFSDTRFAISETISESVETGK